MAGVEKVFDQLVNEIFITMKQIGHKITSYDCQKGVGVFNTSFFYFFIFFPTKLFPHLLSY